MTTDRLRFTLATAALAASVSIAGVASAHEGKSGGKQGSGKAKACKVKGKGYEVQGTFAWADLEQVAGAETARTGDDRFSGTVVVDVQKGNRRGRRDVGLSLYTVTGVRVIGAAADGTLPAEGARVQLVGKQLAAKQARFCDPAATTPESTTPEPTTPESTTPTDTEPSATLAGRPAADRGPKDDPAPDTAGDEVDEHVAVDDDDAASEDRSAGDADDTPSSDDATSSDDAKSSDDKTDDRRKNRSKPSDDDAASDDDTAAAGEASTEPTAVTDVAIRVVHFKVRPAARR